MFKKQKPTRSSVRSRQPSGTLNESFRRNNVVISRRQKEVAARQQSVTQRQAEQKRHLAHKRRKNRIITFVVVALLGLLLYRMQINSVSVESNASSKMQNQQKSEYEQKIYQLYKAEALFGQSWLLDSTQLGKKVITQNPEIERIQFSSTAPISSVLQADIRFRKAVFTWRDASNIEQFVDSEGVLFSKNLEPTVNVSKLIKIEDQSGTVLDTGTSVLTASIVSFIGQLHDKLLPLYGKETGITKVIIPRSTREVQVQMNGSPYVIKFNSTRNLDEQIGELKALLDFMKQGNVVPANYIDLRVAHKAFYK